MEKFGRTGKASQRKERLICILKIFYSLPRLLFCALIRLYQLFISPLLPNHCRFYPSCSEYSLEALKHYGLLRGLAKAFCRIIRCHPWHPGGYDPVLKEPKNLGSEPMSKGIN